MTWDGDDVDVRHADRCRRADPDPGSGRPSPADRRGAPFHAVWPGRASDRATRPSRPGITPCVHISPPPAALLATGALLLALAACGTPEAVPAPTAATPSPRGDHSRSGRHCARRRRAVSPKRRSSVVTAYDAPDGAAVSEFANPLDLRRAAHVLHRGESGRVAARPAADAPERHDRMDPFVGCQP